MATAKCFACNANMMIDGYLHKFTAHKIHNFSELLSSSACLMIKKHQCLSFDK